MKNSNSQSVFIFKGYNTYKDSSIHIVAYKSILGVTDAQQTTGVDLTTRYTLMSIQYSDYIKKHPISFHLREGFVYSVQEIANAAETIDFEAYVSDPTDGTINPISTLFYLMGTTPLGGEGAGAMLTIRPGNGGTISSKFLPINAGANQSNAVNVVKATNGKLYSTTIIGGLSNFGTLFEYDQATNTYRVLVHFSGNTGNFQGTQPCCLIQAANGKLYGGTNIGGANNLGALFEYDLVTSTYTVKVNLTGNVGTQLGARITGRMVESGGKLYGTCRLGGTNNLGTIFEYDYVNNVFTKLYNFATADGSNPAGGLFETSPGVFYGMCNAAGSGSPAGGTIFSYDKNTSTFTKWYDFLTGAANPGANPNGVFVMVGGKLYGFAASGGTGNSGTIFEHVIGTSTITKLHDANINTVGGSLNGSPVVGSDGLIYGVKRTLTGAQGTLFSFNVTGSVYTNLATFVTGVSTGQNPQGTLLETSPGVFYGVSTSGGRANGGTIFEFLTAGNVLTKKIDLNYGDVKQIRGSVIRSSNGKYYGMSAQGGENVTDNTSGCIFEFIPSTGVFVKLANLSASTGIGPTGRLVEHSNGLLYGITATTLISFNKNTNVVTNLQGSLGNSTPGTSPVIAPNGKLYWKTSGDGVNFCGRLWEYDPFSGVATNKGDFVNALNGDDPNWSWFNDANEFLLYDGYLYASALFNGFSIKRYNASNNTYEWQTGYVQGPSHPATDPFGPQGTLTLASNGLMYGLSGGGANNCGTLYSFNPITKEVRKCVDLDAYGSTSSTGQKGHITEFNKKLYWMSGLGGANSVGSVFEYDIETQETKLLLDFNLYTTGGSNTYISSKFVVIRK